MAQTRLRIAGIVPNGFYEQMFNDTAIAEFRGPWGVPVQIGGTLILLPLVFVSFTSGPIVLFYDLVFVAILLGSIFLHELGHAWACLIQGIGVRRIMLYGGGGFCELSQASTPHEDELIVAMGPIVNLVLWAVASLLGPMISDPEIAWAMETVAYINLFLALLNLMPVMPLDGGRLFLLLLLRFMRPGPAYRVAGALGLVIAIWWIPLLGFSYFAFGLVLFFLPSVRLNWRMATGQVN